nr:MAG TPA: hypothetical protein [Caudoviricetes sp.]
MPLAFHPRCTTFQPASRGLFHIWRTHGLQC